MANIVYYEDIQLVDNVKLIAGTSSDIQIYTDNSNNILDFFNLSNVLFRQHFLDGDMTFQCDDGSGGVTTYFKLDGGENRIVYSIDSRYLDNVKSMYGSGADLQIYHGGTNSVIDNLTGDLIITNFQDDGDIKFLSDDGGGNTTEYLSIQGANEVVYFSKDFKLPDNVKGNFGNAGDLKVYHDGR